MADRRAAVGFDPDYFARRAAQGESIPPTEAFRCAYDHNLWGGSESPSGPGSSFHQTRYLRTLLPDLCQRLDIRTLLDLPCGDGHWMAAIEFPGVQYVGADLLPEVVARAAVRRPDRTFQQLDLITSPLPPADLVLCRDCLVHLSFADIARALKNIHRAGIVYLLTTTFPDEPLNRDVMTGDWRPLNLELPPFGFPPPLEMLSEGCTEQGGIFADKSLGLWPVQDIPECECAA